MLIFLSHPTMGAWIEIWNVSPIISEMSVSHPTMGAWIEISVAIVCSIGNIVAPHDGCVD